MAAERSKQVVAILRPKATSGDANEVLSAVRSLNPGDACVYHVGDLSFDKKADEELRLIASEVWNRYLAGELLLTRRRLVSPVPGQPFHGEYIATKTKVTRPVLVREPMAA
jgi:hypothetical protein